MDSWPSGLGSHLNAVTSRVQILARAYWWDPKKVETAIHGCLHISTSNNSRWHGVSNLLILPISSTTVILSAMSNYRHIQLAHPFNKICSVYFTQSIIHSRLLFMKHLLGTSLSLLTGYDVTSWKGRFPSIYPCICPRPPVRPSSSNWFIPHYPPPFLNDATLIISPFPPVIMCYRALNFSKYIIKLT